MKEKNNNISILSEVLNTNHQTTLNPPASPSTDDNIIVPQLKDNPSFNNSYHARKLSYSIEDNELHPQLASANSLQRKGLKYLQTESASNSANSDILEKTQQRHNIKFDADPTSAKESYVCFAKAFCAGKGKTAYYITIFFERGLYVKKNIYLSKLFLAVSKRHDDDRIDENEYRQYLEDEQFLEDVDKLYELCKYGYQNTRALLERDATIGPPNWFHEGLNDILVRRNEDLLELDVSLHNHNEETDLIGVNFNSCCNIL